MGNSSMAVRYPPFQQMFPRFVALGNQMALWLCILMLLAVALNCLPFTAAIPAAACEEQRAEWQTEFSVFLRRLKAIHEQGEVPSESALRAGQHSFAITDGAGGWIDPSASEGTVQYKVNELCRGKKIRWEVTVARDVSKSRTFCGWTLLPAVSKEQKQQKQARVIGIMARERNRSEDRKIKEGSTVLLEGMLGDATKSTPTSVTGVNAVHHLDAADAGETVFLIAVDKAVIRRAGDSGNQ